MSRPRPILPGTTRLLTRRCTQRQLLLRPSAKTNQLVGYALGVAAARTGLQLHAVCVMSNHYHIVATDPEARLPEFWREAHRLIAKSVNASLGRWENLWATEAPSGVELIEDGDLLDKLVYTLVNPVQGRLVAHGHSWPGLRMRFGNKPRRFKRPSIYYDTDGSMPNEVELEMVRPPMLEGLEDNEVIELLKTQVAQRESAIREQVLAAGKKFLGRSTVLAQSPFSRPATSETRRSLSPRVAAKNKWARVEALRRNRDFEEQYREALHRWRAGDRTALFPPGTYWWRISAAAPCAPPPD